jgi:hypothetical protein
MHFRIVIYCILSGALVLSAFPESAHAQDDSSVKSKKRGGRRGKNKKAAPVEDPVLDDDPYDDESDEVAQETDELNATETAAEETPGEDEDQPGSEAGEVAGSVEGALAEQGSLRRSGRVEFDERLVKGQAAKSGAVYLFKRVPRRLPGLVPMRRSYRRRIVEPVLGEREIKPQQIPITETEQSTGTRAEVEPADVGKKTAIGKEPPKSPKASRMGRRGKRKTKTAAQTEEK